MRNLLIMHVDFRGILKGKILLLLCLPLISNGQVSGRGSEGTDISNTTEGVKRALVIGISDYTADALKLNYADNDAAFFREYLAKVEQIPEDRLAYLEDEEAISINVMREFKNLMTQSEEGDTVFIFFAGHGDVVDDFGGEEGFLLAADANEHQEYYGTQGVVPLSILNRVVDKITGNGARVILVLDACRSGFLYKEGAQKNLQTLNNNFQNSIKFLSCGPDQLSYESEEIEHGFFTYYLVLGMMGAADNLVQDNNLQYFELETFLDNSVKNETNQRQIPVVWNQKATDVFKAVDPRDKKLAMEQIGSSASIKDLLASRGGTENTKTMYRSIPIVQEFNQALKSKNWIGKEGSAHKIFLRALSDPAISKEVKEKMKYSLVQQLSLSAQLLINTYLDEEEILPSSDYFVQNAAYLDICLELLTPEDFIYDRLKVSKLFLEGYAPIRSRNYSAYPEAKRKLEEALALEDNAAYIHNALGILYNYEERFKDAEKHYRRAMELIPSWSYPVNNLGSNYYNQYRYEEAGDLYNQALKLQLKNGSALNNLGAISKGQGKYALAERFFHKVKETTGKYSSTTLRNLGNLYRDKGDIGKALAFLEEALEKHPRDVYNYYSLSDLLHDEKVDTDRATKLLVDAIKLEPFYSRGFAKYADLLRRYPKDESSLKKADSLYRFAISNDPHYEWAYAGRGWLYHKQQKPEAALASFQEGIKTNNQKARPYYYLANFYKDGLKKSPEAEKYYKEAIARDSFYLPAYKSLIGLYNGNNQENLSLDLLKGLLKWQSDAPDIWKLLGDTYFAQGEQSQAILYYGKALEVDSTYARGYVNLAYSQLQAGKTMEAVKSYGSAIRYNPFNNKPETFASLLLTESRKQKRAGNLDIHIDILEAAYKFDSSNETGHALANAYYQSEQTLAALELAEEFLEGEISKSWQIKWMELAIKAAIELSQKDIVKQYWTTLLHIDPIEKPILRALVSYSQGDITQAKEILKTANPLTLRPRFLQSRFSKTTIGILENLKQ
ncbi:tetratricopeptide repeat protein [Robiginitalea sp. IMCC44478]|uniref:tetratricopeptide repeat protein n=1 Tax=Robiginitalea sp. IMCC44478 TaxID=3459122 RepID=UPI004041D3C0